MSAPFVAACLHMYSLLFAYNPRKHARTGCCRALVSVFLNMTRRAQGRFEMTQALALRLVDLLSGAPALYGFFIPIIATLGSGLTGSTTTSNFLFARLQVRAAAPSASGTLSTLAALHYYSLVLVLPCQCHCVGQHGKRSQPDLAARLSLRRHARRHCVHSQLNLRGKSC